MKKLILQFTLLVSVNCFGQGGYGSVVLPGNVTCANEYINVSPCVGLSTLSYNGYAYDLVEIGGQCWFKENLQTTKLLISQLQDIKSANKVKKTLSKRYEKRNGGYTRIIKAGFRYGDNAPMAIIEFVDRDVEAKRVDRKKKDITKDPKEEKKLAKA